MSWVVERVLSLKMLNIDSSTDPFGYLGQICQGGGQKIKNVFNFPQSFPRFAALLYALCSLKNFPFRSFVILTSYFFLLFALVKKKLIIL